MHLHIRILQRQDIPEIVAAFTRIGWSGKTTEQYERYAAEQEKGLRVTPVAFWEGQFAGYVNIVWEPDYVPFRAAGVPEVQDFNVLPELQRRGIGSCLMEEAERIAGERSTEVGIGVGMTADYGNAQRMYVKRGYIPDGRGLTSDDRFLLWGDIVRVDDGLILWFTKRLR